MKEIRTLEPFSSSHLLDTVSTLLLNKKQTNYILRTTKITAIYTMRASREDTYRLKDYARKCKCPHKKSPLA